MLFAFSPVCIPRRVGVGLDLGGGGGSGLFVQISQETTKAGGQTGRQAGGEICNGAGEEREEGGRTTPSSVLTKEMEQKESQLVLPCLPPNLHWSHANQFYFHAPATIIAMHC